MPAKVAKEASQRVKGDWFTGSVLFFVNVKMRNFDVGLDDGHITPTLLPGVTECPNVEPTPYPVPTLDAVTRHGFSMKIQTRCREWERDKIFVVLFGDRRDRRIDPEVHIPRLMEYLRQNAIDKYGYMVEPETSRALRASVTRRWPCASISWRFRGCIIGHSRPVSAAIVAVLTR